MVALAAQGWSHGSKWMAPAEECMCSGKSHKIGGSITIAVGFQSKEPQPLGHNLLEPNPLPHLPLPPLVHPPPPFRSLPPPSHPTPTPFSTLPHPSSTPMPAARRGKQRVWNVPNPSEPPVLGETGADERAGAGGTSISRLEKTKPVHRLREHLGFCRTSSCHLVSGERGRVDVDESLEQHGGTILVP